MFQVSGSGCRLSAAAGYQSGFAWFQEVLVNNVDEVIKLIY